MRRRRKKYVELKALKGKMRGEGQTIKSIANHLCIAPNTLCLKINGISEFTCSEIGEVCDFLGIKPDDIVEYFFPSMFREETKNIRGA